MPDVLAVAEAAMRAGMATLDRVSHNVANSATPAFKRELAVRAGFDAQLQTALSAEPVRDWSAGALRASDNPLNFAIEGDGWFQLRSPYGIVLTRDGSFRVDNQGQLTALNGWPVVLEGAASLPPGPVTLRENGELWVESLRVGRFLIADAQGNQLHAAGAGVFRSTEPFAELASPVIRQGYLEGANVNSLTEMVDLIATLRHAEAAQRVMQAYDEAMQTALTTLGEF
jgi:flagellar basal-body rod protein FlgF